MRGQPPKENIKKLEQPKPVDKPFNLTETLINFVKKAYATLNDTDKEKFSETELEEMMKRRQAEIKEKEK